MILEADAQEEEEVPLAFRNLEQVQANVHACSLIRIDLCMYHKKFVQLVSCTQSRDSNLNL